MEKTPAIEVGKAANAARLELMALCLVSYGQAQCDAVQHVIQAALNKELEGNTND